MFLTHFISGNAHATEYRVGRGVELEPVTLLNVRVLDYLACPNCGALKMRQVGKCCTDTCRVALYRWRKAQIFNPHTRDAEKARRPVQRIGARSLKPLRSYNTEYQGSTLRTANRACLEST